MNLKRLTKAVRNNQKIIWNDPDPIEGNDYTVQKIWGINRESAMIQYGAEKENYLSEAEVFISELSLKY
jgi:hypothetical protein